MTDQRQDAGGQASTSADLGFAGPAGGFRAFLMSDIRGYSSFSAARGRAESWARGTIGRGCCVRHLTVTVVGDVRSVVVKARKELTMGVKTRHAKKLLAVGVIAAGGVCAASTAATATAGKPTAQPVQASWVRCSLHIHLSGTEVSPVEVSHLSCARAKRAIQRGQVLMSPGGPIFSTRGYTCRSTSILPRVDPSPNQLPAAEFCRHGRNRLSFVWDYAN
jgi:hypothetical protein